MGRIIWPVLLVGFCVLAGVMLLAPTSSSTRDIIHAASVKYDEDVAAARAARLDAFLDAAAADRMIAAFNADFALQDSIAGGPTHKWTAPANGLGGGATYVWAPRKSGDGYELANIIPLAPATTPKPGAVTP